MKMKKLITISICLLMIPLIPSVVGIPCKIEKVGDGDLQCLKKFVVIGFFPQISSDNITYFGIPQFQWMIIPKDKFEGYIGIIFIYGFYDPSPVM